jgi:hypothetical protein
MHATAAVHTPAVHASRHLRIEWHVAEVEPITPGRDQLVFDYCFQLRKVRRA